MLRCDGSVVREHGWVVPGSYVLAAVAPGTALPELDRHNKRFCFLAASAAEKLLAAIASGMIAFTDRDDPRQNHFVYTGSGRGGNSSAAVPANSDVIPVAQRFARSVSSRSSVCIRPRATTTPMSAPL